MIHCNIPVDNTNLIYLTELLFFLFMLEDRDTNFILVFLKIKNGKFAKNRMMQCNCNIFIF